MVRTLESLEPGTPVYVGAERVGEVRGVYAEGDARVVEMLAVKWETRDDLVVVPTDEVVKVDDEGVHLMRSKASDYADLAPFDESRFPTVRKIR